MGINKNFDNFCRNVRILHDFPGDKDPASPLEKPAWGIHRTLMTVAGDYTMGTFTRLRNQETMMIYTGDLEKRKP